MGLQEDDIDEDEELMFVGEASPSSISSELVFMGEALSPRTLQDLAESGVDISLVEEKPPVAGKNTPDDATRRFNSAEAGHCASTRAAPLSDAPFQDVSPTGNDFSTRFDPRETTPRGRLGGPSNMRLPVHDLLRCPTGARARARALFLRWHFFRQLFQQRASRASTHARADQQGRRDLKYGRDGKKNVRPQ